MIHRTVIFTIMAFLLAGTMGCKKKSAEEEMEALAKRLDNATEEEAGRILEKMDALSRRQEEAERKQIRSVRLKLGQSFVAEERDPDTHELVTKYSIKFTQARYSLSGLADHDDEVKYIIDYHSRNLGPRQGGVGIEGPEVKARGGYIYSGSCDHRGMQPGQEADNTLSFRIPFNSIPSEVSGRVRDSLVAFSLKLPEVPISEAEVGLPIFWNAGLKIVRCYITGLGRDPHVHLEYQNVENNTLRVLLNIRWYDLNGERAGQEDMRGPIGPSGKENLVYRLNVKSPQKILNYEVTVSVATGRGLPSPGWDPGSLPRVSPVRQGSSQDRPGSSDNATSLSCQSNLRTISQNIHIYAISNGHFPQSQQELVEFGGYSRLFQCPDPNGSQYVYIPGQDGSMPPTNVLVYESKPVHDGRCHVLFLGGQVALLNPEGLRQAIEIAQDRSRTSITPVAESQTARTQLLYFGVALDGFEIDVGRYPTTVEGLRALMERPTPSADGWQQAYLKSIPKDPWNNEYLYRCPGQYNPDAYDLHSNGPDQKLGGGDDITNWSEERNARLERRSPQSPASVQDNRAVQSANAYDSIRSPSSEAVRVVGDDDDGSHRIGFIAREAGGVYWDRVHEGAVRAGKEEGHEVLWLGPTRETDYQAQIAFADTLIRRGVTALVLAPNDEEALRPSVERICTNAIPCMIVDSTPKIDAHFYRITTGNYEGGVLAAKRIAGLLDGRGQVIVLEWPPISDAIGARVKGFRDIMAKEFPGVQISDSKYPNPPIIVEARDIAISMLAKNPEVDVIFACNGVTTGGALVALRSLRSLANKPLLVGFDASPMLIDGLRRGDLDSLVVQDAYNTGYRAVKAITQAAQGKPIPKCINVGVELVTRDRLDEPKIRDLLEGQ